MTRDQIKEELLKFADSYISDFDNLTIIQEDKAKGYAARQGTSQFGNVIVIKHRADGFKEEDFNKWKGSMVETQQKLNARLTPVKLDDVEGHTTYHMKMSMPMFISNRTIISTFYDATDSDGSPIVIASSRGNEKIVEARKDEIGSDVVAL